MEKAKNKNESFIRWQGRTIEEFGRTINLILATSIATIGFIVNKLLEKEFCLINCYAKVFIFTGATTLFITIIILLFLVRMRLVNFRNTTKISRAREKNRKESIDILRESVKKTGFRIWDLFDVSIWFFGLGEMLTIIGFSIHLISK